MIIVNTKRVAAGALEDGGDGDGCRMSIGKDKDGIARVPGHRAHVVGGVACILREAGIAKWVSR